MSAEKEIVNFWYNKRGFFTINNIKTNSNKDIGLLALKFDNDGINEILHIGVNCSITNNISETTNLPQSISRIVNEKFEDKSISEAIKSHLKQFLNNKAKLRKTIILGSVPKSRKSEIVKEFNQRDVEAIDFENVLYDVMENLDTQYYRNDIIRTLQLTKFLLLLEPAKLAKLLVDDKFSSSSRKEFLSNILDKDEIVKEFKKTNTERMAAILKNSGLKPSELASMLENNILNKRTRKMFLDSLMQQEKTRKLLKKSQKVKKSEMPLGKFF